MFKEKMNNQEVYEKIKEELLYLLDQDIIIIVEGKKDQQALEQLGLTNIKRINKQPRYQLIESCFGKEVCLLTDLDKEGEKLYKLFQQEMAPFNIKLRNRLRTLLKKTTLRQIEGLYHHLLRQAPHLFFA